jgi:hypothetical protein
VDQTLEREEYIEQAYFFRVFRERLEDNTPSQEVLGGIREEILATTRLPMAIDFLVGELHLKGRLGEGMARLPHYFLPFQTFIVQHAEEDESKFDFRIALRILEREAELRATDDLDPAALFIYQFECIARNHLGYEEGMRAIAADPTYSADWRDWITRIRMQLGTVDFAQLIYLRSEQHVLDVRKRRNDAGYQPSYPILFDAHTGRIARANLGKDPLYMFAALQRQLGYPTVPRPDPPRTGPLYEPHIEHRFQRLESRLSLLEQEQKGGLDLSKFYKNPGKEPDEET